MTDRLAVARTPKGLRCVHEQGCRIYACCDMLDDCIDHRYADSAAPMTVIATGWAVVRADGKSVDFDKDASGEDQAWWHAGFRTSSAIAAAKSCGARAFRCEVREIGEET